jgi:signal transduction histidine kinase
VDIQFSINLNHDSLLVNGDAQLIKVALMNLMDNGCKYSDDSQVSVNLHAKNSKFVSIEFTNHASGIVEEDMNKIFAPFYRGKNITKQKGSGIGLSLVKSIVQLHNGFITTESTPGALTRFTVSLPLMQRPSF